MADAVEKTYTDWSIDVGDYKYEGITLNEVEQNLYAIEDQEQNFVVISPSKAILIDNKMYNFVQVCNDEDTDLLHIGLAFHLACSDAADHDVDVNVSRMVVPIRVSADDGGMTGKVFFAEFQAKCLCLFHGQAVVGCISGVKADDILVAFDITMLGILTILSVCQQTSCCKREIATLKGVEQVRIPQLRLALFIQKLLPGERIVLVNEIRFNGRVVRVFRGDMLELFFLRFHRYLPIFQDLPAVNHRYSQTTSQSF